MPGADAPATTTPSPVPSTPAGLAAKVGDKQLEITWTTDAAVSKYNLYHGANSNIAIGAGGVTQIANITSPYTLGSLTNGTPHSIALTAENAEGKESTLSSIVTETPAAPISETMVCNGDLDKTYSISTFAGNGNLTHAGMGGGRLLLLQLAVHGALQLIARATCISSVLPIVVFTRLITPPISLRVWQERGCLEITIMVV